MMEVIGQVLTSFHTTICFLFLRTLFLIPELDLLGLPFMRGSKKSKFAAFDQFILFTWLECCYM